MQLSIFVELKLLTSNIIFSKIETTQTIISLRTTSIHDFKLVVKPALPNSMKLPTSFFLGAMLTRGKASSRSSLDGQFLVVILWLIAIFFNSKVYLFHLKNFFFADWQPLWLYA
jgi:hypothetical protein